MKELQQQLPLELMACPLFCSYLQPHWLVDTSIPGSFSSTDIQGGANTIYIVYTYISNKTKHTPFEILFYLKEG